MSENILKIPISIAGKNAELTIKGENSNIVSVSQIEISSALENGEALYQIKEGCFYEYKITDGYTLEKSEIVNPSGLTESSGRISPNIYVGTLEIGIIDPENNRGTVNLEVLSVKTDYRTEYKFMLEEITEKCTELLFLHSSPVSQKFDVDFTADARILYQRFAFIKSVLDSEEFYDAVHKILSSPVTKWKENEISKDIRGLRRINNNILRQIAGSSNRIKLPDNHPLENICHSLPSKIKTYYKSETVDTPENRFVKHALNSFLSLIGEFRLNLSDNSRSRKEAIILEDKLEQILEHSIFKEISSLSALPLNSPVLQRKEGYREILRLFLMIDLAAKLTWRGGEDVYNGNKRDVAILYEYWLFFKLLEIVKKVFRIEPKEINELISGVNGNLELKLRQGEYFPVKGIFNSGSRKLNIEFAYNKTFTGKNEYPASGSWTKSMRPDYTLCIWPNGIGINQAEKEELVVYIHFDAKYKVDKLIEIIGEDQNLNEEKTEQRKGTYKRADLLKMHAYKDAIRRTAGAYVIYPGDESELPYKPKGFHELIPGLGAFALRPSRINNGSEVLESFLKEVVDHFLNRASQREKIALETYEIYKDKNSGLVKESLPEPYGSKRDLLPDSTFVLVGFYKSKDHLNWVLKNNLYNTRTGTDKGSIHIDSNFSGVRYLLLHGKGNSETSLLYKLDDKGPRIFSKRDLEKKDYPEPDHDLYLVFKISGECDNEFKKRTWDVKKLNGYKKGNAKAIPFTASLTDLMDEKVLKN